MSKDNIAKQSILPERQSKINLMMRQEEHGLEEQVYCICRSSDASRFMIGCDYCEEWYHGDCIDITEEESRFIKKFFCPKCRQRDPSLTIKYKQKKLEQCESCKGKPRQQCQYRVCLTFAPKQKKVETVAEEEEIAIKPVLNEANYSDDDVWEPSLRKEKPTVPSSKPSRHSTNKKEKAKGRHRSSAISGDHRRRKRITSSTDSGGESEIEKSPARSKQKVIHCYGPQCINASRPGSKYCSDQCGLKLATTRIYQILPQRIQEWGLTPCIAEEKNKKELELIRKQQNEAREALEELDLKQKELDITTAKAKKFTVDINSDDEADEAGDCETESATVQCVTCGIGITVSNAIRHMERCFNKYESQTSFGSIFQTKIEGNNMFCDFYNPSNRTYCKRLRVLCPEHCKDPKVNDTDVCGYPLVREVFEETGDFCLIQKKKCVKHNNWEKLRRAEIDMERVRQWLKLDELFEKERQIRTAMAQRAGLLPLILHSTFNHELMQQQYSGHSGATAESGETIAINKNAIKEDDACCG
ncbi:hypothetical protein OUZ56_030892 [Daphnia magna]|uniref:CXXC-type zinc finger protein 1 n=1 Tax=Daphnia magna TaxID=35525 RepID=A0ABQ9ZT58_9CRUS|nr:hypothetical protein OUZ56_030892 [Daphnia magna]